MPSALTNPTTGSTPVLREFDTLLESMLGLQRKEQALILARKTEELASTTQSIEWMGLRMQGMGPSRSGRELDEAAQGRRRRAATSPRSWRRSSGWPRRNHTLLEHSLYFLQQLFQQVMERDHAAAPLQQQRPRLPRRHGRQTFWRRASSAAHP